ncbi:hypothetical protein ES703_122098 [subsurface metagenome]
MLILQKNLAKGWDVAKSKAESAGGALKQMKNILYDITEVIGAPFLPGIKKSALAIKAWAKENVANIAWWAQKTFSYVTLVKDVFWDFVVFMKQDWRAGLAFAFGSFLELLKATFKTAVILAIAGGKGIWKGVKEGLLGGDEKELSRKMEQIEKRRTRLYRAYETEWGKAGDWDKPFKPPKESRRLEYPALKALAEKELLQQKTKSILGKSLDAAADTFKQAIDNISKDMPDDFRKAYDESLQKHKKRFEELGAKPGKIPPGESAAAGAPVPFSMAMADMMKEARSALAQKLAPLEARFLTFKPGATFDIERRQVTLMGQNVQNTKNMFQALKDIKSDIKVLLQEIVRQFHRPQSMEPVRVTNFG